MYQKQVWQNGDTITADKLNHIENGIDFNNVFRIAYFKAEDPRTTYPEGVPELPQTDIWLEDTNRDYYKLYHDSNCTQEYTYQDYLNPIVTIVSGGWTNENYEEQNMGIVTRYFSIDIINNSRCIELTLRLADDYNFGFSIYSSPKGEK